MKKLELEKKDLKVSSVYIPENWIKNKETRRIGYLNWLCYTICSTHYVNDQRV